MNFHDILMLRGFVGGGSGGGGATTWDELEGKPFGEEEIIVLPETQLTFADVGGGAMGTIVELATAPSATGAYTVIYNGEAYSCQPVVLAATAFAIGNVGYFMGGESTGEPFVVVIDGTTAQIASVVAESSATISIKSLTTVPIPAKYAPKAVIIDLSGDEFPSIRTDKEVEFNLSDDIYNELITANEQSVIRLIVRYSNIDTMVPSDSLKTGTTCIVASIFHLIDKEFVMEALLWDNFVCFETTDSKTFTAIAKRLSFAT